MDIPTMLHETAREFDRMNRDLFDLRRQVEELNKIADAHQAAFREASDYAGGLVVKVQRAEAALAEARGLLEVLESSVDIHHVFTDDYLERLRAFLARPAPAECTC